MAPSRTHDRVADEDSTAIFVPSNPGRRRVAAPPTKQTRAALPPPAEAPAKKFATVRVIGRYLGHELSERCERIDFGATYELGASQTDLADPYLDPVQARIVPRRLGFSIEDMDSTNGVFVLLRHPIGIQDGDSFRLGSQLLVFHEAGRRTVASLGVPHRELWGRVDVMITTNLRASVHPLRERELLIGRSEGGLRFPTDGHLSRAHCRLSEGVGGVTLEDLSSSNGTYHRLRGRTLLPYGTVLLAGQTLWRVDAG